MRFGVAAMMAGMIGAAGAALANDPARVTLSAAEPVRVGLTATSQAFSAADASGGLSGFNVDIVNEICRRINRPCELKEYPFRDILPSVAAGRLDIGVANLLKTPERARQALFTTPYWRSTSSFIGKSGAKLPHLTALLTDYRVCVIAATRQDSFLRGLPGAGDKSVVALPSNRETLLGLRDRLCDFALVPTVQALSFLQAADGAGFAFVGFPLMDQGLGGEVHLVVTPKRPELLKEVDDALKALIREGVHERISRRHFPFSIL